MVFYGGQKITHWKNSFHPRCFSRTWESYLRAVLRGDERRRSEEIELKREGKKIQNKKYGGGHKTRSFYEPLSAAAPNDPALRALRLRYLVKWGFKEISLSEPSQIEIVINKQPNEEARNPISWSISYIRAEQTARRRCYAAKNRIAIRDQLNVPTEFDEFLVFFVLWPTGVNTL